MVWTSLVRGRYKESLQVGEKDVAAAVQVGSGDEKQQADAFEYKMQPIVLIVPRGSAPAAMEARQKEAEALRGRVQTCAEANALFKSMQNAAIREIVVKTSADIPPVLREAARQDSGRPSDPARGDKTGRGDGCAVRTESDHHRHAEEEGNPRQDVYRKIRGEVESVPAGSPQSRDDRISRNENSNDSLK